MIKAVLFDVGGTLLKVSPSVGTIYSDIAAQFGVSVKSEELDRRFRVAWETQRRSNDPIDKIWWRIIVQIVFKPTPIPKFDDFFETLYQKFTDPSVWHVFPDVIPTLQKLKKSGLTLAVASNWDSRLPKLLEDLNLAPFFDHQFISFKMGLNKSDPAFYLKCLQRLNLKPAQVFHIGDDEENDVLIPQSIGIQSYLIKRSFQDNGGQDSALLNINWPVPFDFVV